MSRAKKKQKTEEASSQCTFEMDDNVDYIRIPPDEGQREVRLFRRTGDKIMTFQACRDEIEDRSRLSLTIDYDLYPGFKEALKALLTSIENAGNNNKIIVVHGIPLMGKSSLAECLAYFLTCESGFALLVRMKKIVDSDMDEITDNLSLQLQHLRSNKGYAIIDQCNLNCIRRERFLNIISSMKGMLPVIIFTSGHYEPPESWKTDPLVLTKVISVTIDEMTVVRIQERYGFNKELLGASDILSITTVYGRVPKILCSLHARSKEGSMPLSRNRVENTLYETSALVTAYERMRELFWVLFPNLVSKSKEDINSLAEANPEEWRVKPERIQLVGLLLRDCADMCENVVLNCAILSGEEDDSTRGVSGYCEYRSHYYYFPCLSKLQKLIKDSHEHCTPSKLYKTLLHFYQQTLPRFCNAEALKGDVFENLVRLGCELGEEPTGLRCTVDHVSRVGVTEVVNPRDEQELVKAVKKCCDNSRAGGQSFWCVLNYENFKGYHFAFVEASSGKITSFELFQATVNAGSHPTQKMIEALSYLKSQLQIDPKPYFLVPKEKYVPEKPSHNFQDIPIIFVKTTVLFE